MADFKITRLKKIKEVNNCMAHNYYYLVYFRLIDRQKKQYKKGHFVIWLDAFDVQEYFEKDFYTTEDVKQLAGEMAVNTLECFSHDFENTKELYTFCNQTIEDYNRII